MTRLMPPWPSITWLWILDAEGLGSEMPLAFHMLALRDTGMPLGKMFNLEALGNDCAADGRYSFMLAAPPLEVKSATLLRSA
ncbi:hypothetical protein IVA95_27960 [Bradyrhizobium sp. 157]|uniref:hypothetical protein n=1 Tax=Bradyrhizobium sp. 157 TaxID=2782631 RepID=UPI001FFAC5F9|nr:hypothetical protein [Bradyrhizobium sp. 157]MCK1641310.1 hypothetical protein [Bradyrhizobium sp. 157]